MTYESFESTTTFEQCAVEALRLVTELNQLGVLASVRLDTTIKISVPPYGTYEWEIKETCGQACQPYEFDNLLTTLKEALKFEQERRNRNERAANVLDGLPRSVLTILKDADDLQNAVKSALLRKHER